MSRITVYLIEPVDSPYYYLQWLDPATQKRVTRSTRSTSQREAEARRADKEYELNHGLHQEPARMTWESFVANYEEEKLAALPEESRQNYLRSLRYFGLVLAGRPLAAISERLVSAFRTQLEARGWLAGTVKAHLARLRAALRWAVRQKLLPQAPLFEMPKLPRKGVISTLDREGYEKLLAAMPGPAWRLLTQLAWFTGMRRGELLALCWGEQVDKPWVALGTPPRIWIPAAACKGDEDTWLPIHEELLALLQAAPQSKGALVDIQMAPYEVSRRFGGIARGAGLNITLHDLRRSFGTRYAQVVPAQVLQRLMRHRDLKTTLGYYVDQDKGLDDAIRRA